jgi:hypothetical protein
MAKQKERNIFEETRTKSEDDFEKNLTYISAGALGLSLTFIEKIVVINSSTIIWTLIIGWVLLGLTLTLNLISHLISSYYSRKSQEEFDNDCKNLNKNIDLRNQRISIINWSTVILLILGIFFIIIFTSQNISNMAKNTTTKPVVSVPEKLGRTLPKPQDTVPNKPKTNTNSNGKK